MLGATNEFSAIVVSYYTGPVLEACLTALIEAPLCGQIVVVNNGNPAPVLAKLAALSKQVPKLTLIDGHGNVGFGRACNLGASHATERLIAFVNPDCILDAGALPALSDTLLLYPNALVGGSLRNRDGSEQRGCRRGAVTKWSAFVTFTGWGRLGPEAGIWRSFNRVGEVMPTEVVDMPVVSGALMAIGLAHFQKLGGFDPAFFLHVEDIDLCHRVHQGGGVVKFAPKATALHLGGTSEASSWSVERAKIVSFGRYFWKNATTIGDYLGTIALMPLIATALVLRMILKNLRG